MARVSLGLDFADGASEVAFSPSPSSSSSDLVPLSCLVPTSPNPKWIEARSVGQPKGLLGLKDSPMVVVNNPSGPSAHPFRSGMEFSQSRRSGGPVFPPPSGKDGRKRKASGVTAMEIAGDPEAIALAVENFEDNMYAPNTTKTKNALRKTWRSICEARNIETLPLTPQGMVEVSAVLKAAQFRSGHAYIYEMKQWHLREGFVWNDFLEMTLQDCKRSLTRAIGPPSRAAEVKLMWLARMRGDGLGEAHQPFWPERRKAVWILATRFLLREVELGCLSYSSDEVSFDTSERTVTLHLPTSKVDPQARGCRRTLACSCGKASKTLIHTCAYCAAWELVSFREKILGIGRCDERAKGLPLVGQASHPERFVTKDAMISAFRSDITNLQAAGLVDSKLDVNTVTGHTFRRSGIKFLAREGILLDLIQHLSRHSSSAVMAYVEEALEEVPSAAMKLQQHMNLQDQISQLALRTTSFENLLKDATERLDAMSLKISRETEGTAMSESDTVKCLIKSFLQPEVVINVATGKFHSTKGCWFGDVPLRWRTFCGWHWVSAGRFVQTLSSKDDIQEGWSPCDKCKDCLPNWCF